MRPVRKSDRAGNFGKTPQQLAHAAAPTLFDEGSSGALFSQDNRRFKRTNDQLRQLAILDWYRAPERSFEIFRNIGEPWRSPRPYLRDSWIPDTRIETNVAGT